ncbi:hypothetical protein PG993_001410 [Apiospora rasikravindrae]|uniref:Uncharacterized protein n=1 Tax=Apiospora rasikravindrae TaxID=990691 RepID=A0ABR1UB99_9PEZI
MQNISPTQSSTTMCDLEKCIECSRYSLFSGASHGAAAFTSTVPDPVATNAAAAAKPTDGDSYHAADMAALVSYDTGSLSTQDNGEIDPDLDPRLFCPMACGVSQIVIVGWLEALKLNGTIPQDFPAQQMAEDSLLPCMEHCETARQKGLRPEPPQQ